MSGAQVRQIRRRLGLSVSAFATLLGVHPVTVRKWELEMQGMRRPAERLIRLLDSQGLAVLRRPPKRKSARRRRR
jgi:DNA-binding transcriptional regulator YiaG